MTRTSPWREKVWQAAGLLARWVLGGIFIYMGLTKALHPEVFLKLVRQYEIVHQPLLLNAIAAGLPWFEVFCGVLLVTGIAVRGTALLLVAMLVPFTAVVMHRALALAGAEHLALCAVKFDCGCGNGEVFVCTKVMENCLLLLLACWLLLTGHAQGWCARFSLFAGQARSASAKDITAGAPIPKL